LLANYKRKNFLPFIAFGLLLLAPLVNFLQFNNYNFAAPESIIIIVVLLATAGFLSVIYRVAGWGGRVILISGLITLTFSFFPGWHSLLALLLTFLMALLLGMLFSRKLLELIVIFAAVFILAILLFPSPRPISVPQLTQRSEQAINTKLPPIIYLVLDEHAGLAALPTLTPQEQQVKTRLQNFYQQSGFFVYASAYSHYPATANSLPNLFNYSTSNQDDYYFPKTNDRVLVKNDFFRLLTQKGYQIRVYQPDFIDYCQAQGAAISSCYTYPSLSMRNIEKVKLSFADRWLLLSKGFLLQSALFQLVMHEYQDWLQPWLVKDGYQPPPWNWYQARISSLTMPSIFARVQHDVSMQPQGTVFFAHVLAPHNPFAYDANCRLLPASQWQIARGPAPFVNSLATKQARYALYEGQLVCVQKQLQMFFSQLQRAGIYQHAIIIVHGDHGSRIALHSLTPENKAQLTQQDFRDYYQTLFAVKLPGQGTGYDQQLRSLQQILAQVTQTITGQAVQVASDVPFVYLYPDKSHGIMLRMNKSAFRS